MRRFLGLCHLLSFTVPLATTAARADALSFQCSWENRAPIHIAIDTTTMTASRDDGGHRYRVIKISPWAVWLLVDQPDNVAAAAVHMIERSSSFDDREKAGKWVDVLINAGG
ncbi:hypothetical protein AB4144_37905, partial [Rhizobiaceae sp. 2RAB30]